MKENYADVLESYLIPAEEGLFSKLKEKRERNLAKLNDEKTTKFELWSKEKYDIKKIIEVETTRLKKESEYKSLSFKYTFDPNKFSFGDNDILPISDPKCKEIYVEYDLSNNDYSLWDDFFRKLLSNIKYEITKSIKSKLYVRGLDDSIIYISI